MSDDRKNNDGMDFDDIDDFLSMDDDGDTSDNFGDIFDDDRPDTDPEDDIALPQQGETTVPEPTPEALESDSGTHEPVEDSGESVPVSEPETPEPALPEEPKTPEPEPETPDESLDDIFDLVDDTPVTDDSASVDGLFTDDTDDADESNEDLSAFFPVDEDMPEPDYMASTDLDDDDTTDSVDVDPDLAAMFDSSVSDDEPEDDPEPDKKDKKKKRKKKDKKKKTDTDTDGKDKKSIGKKVGTGVGIVAVIAIIGAGGYFYSSSKGPSTPDEKPQPAKLQLVNQEQVEWAGSVCRIMDDVSKNAKIPDVFKGTNIDPLKARNQLSKVFVANSKVMTTAANSFKDLPKDNYDRVKDIQFAPSVMTNWKKIGDSPDTSIIKASNSLMNTLDNYSRNLTSYSTRLDGVATYNATGLIDAVTSAREDFINASQSMETNLKKTLSSTSIFDNAATMKAVSELPFCGNRFVTESDLVKIEKELKEQKVVYNYVTHKRCTAFIDTARQVGREDDLAMMDVDEQNTSETTSSEPSTAKKSESAKGKKPSKDAKAVKKDKKGKKLTEAELRDKRVSDTFRSDIRACNEFLKLAVPDDESPVLAHGVDSQDDLRAEPKLPGYAEEIIGSGVGANTASETTTPSATTSSTTTSSSTTKQKKN